MTFLDKLLQHFNLTAEQYQHLTKPVSELTLPPWNEDEDFKKIKTRIIDAVAKNEKIVIYGDYDCDGIMATSILVKALAFLNYHVGYYIPNRYFDGYGLNVVKVEEMYEKGYSLIITVDNGINQHEAIKRAGELGMDVIVTDHHLPSEKLPNAFAFMHPQLNKYGSINCCGAYVAYMLSCALLGYGNPYLLSLAAIATISDMMPLQDYNRDIVRMGLDFINKYQYSSIISLAQCQNINEETISLVLAPKVNSIGRIVENANINRLIKYFAYEEKKTLPSLEAWINETNEHRKKETKKIIENLSFSEQNPAIIVFDENCREGLIGLVASRLVNLYQKPVVVFTADCLDPNILIGSARSKEGFNLAKAFQGVEELLLNSGGHALAGGLSIKREDLDLFHQKFNHAAEKHPIITSEKEVINLAITDINHDNYSLFTNLSPFGCEWEKPVLQLQNLPVAQIKYVASGKHLLIPLAISTSIIGFNLDRTCFDEIDYIDIYGDFRLNFFKKTKNLQFVITNWQKSNVKCS